MTRYVEVIKIKCYNYSSICLIICELLFFVKSIIFNAEVGADNMGL